MRISRRGLLIAGAGAGTAWAFHPIVAQASITESGEGFARFSAAGAEVIALNEGTVRRPMDENFVRNAPLAAVQAALAAAGLPTDHIMVPYTPFVILAAGRRFLIDAGFADNGPEGTGLLHQSMRNAGIDPGSIDTVLMSHFHGDHINGLRRRDGSLVYPDARVYLPQPELDHWMSDERMNAVPENARGGFNAVRRVLGDYPEDRLVRFTPGERIEGLIDTIPCFGHAPGQTAFAIGSGADSFTYMADVSHFPALFVANPDWSVMFDMNPDLARETRRSVLSRMASQGGLVGAYHFPFPSLGRIAPAGGGFAFDAGA